MLLDIYKIVCITFLVTAATVKFGLKASMDEDDNSSCHHRMTNLQLVLNRFFHYSLRKHSLWE